MGARGVYYESDGVGGPSTQTRTAKESRIAETMAALTKNLQLLLAKRPGLILSEKNGQKTLGWLNEQKTTHPISWPIPAVQ